MDAKTIRALGQIIISVFCLAIVAVIAVEAFRTGNVPMQQMIAGAAIGFGLSAVTFWVGSSAGSQSKDETIANSFPVGTAPPSGAPAPASWAQQYAERASTAAPSGTAPPPAVHAPVTTEVNSSNER